MISLKAQLIVSFYVVLRFSLLAMGSLPNSRIDSLNMKKEQADRVVPCFIHSWKMDQGINTSRERS
jgi:hypothetical protein